MLINFLIFVTTGEFLASGAPTPLIDLSYSFDQKTPNFPSATKYSSTVAFNGTEPFGYWVLSNDFCSSEHSGTHMDAPLHFIPGAQAVDQVPYENLYRVAGIKINVCEKVKLNPNYAITVQDMEDWIAKHGAFPDGVVILFQTGFEKKSYDPIAYAGMDENGKFNYPGIGKEAAEWIVNYANKTGQARGVLGVGLDSLSLDIGNPFVPDAHLTLLGKEIFGLENLRNLDLLPAWNFTLTMLPMKIAKGTGGPTRVLAELGGTTYFAQTV